MAQRQKLPATGAGDYFSWDYHINSASLLGVGQYRPLMSAPSLMPFFPRRYTKAAGTEPEISMNIRNSIPMYGLQTMQSVALLIE